MKSYVTLRGRFSAAHLYKINSWSTEANLAAFGRCFSAHGHGHNYTVEVSFLNLPQSLQIKAQEEVLSFCDSLEHKHLNFDVPYFKDKNPTTEMLALYTQETLNQSPVIAPFLAKVRIIEIEGLWSDLTL